MRTRLVATRGGDTGHFLVVLLVTCCTAIFVGSYGFGRRPAKTPLAPVSTWTSADIRVPSALAASGQAHRWPAAWLGNKLLLNVGTSLRKTSLAHLWTWTKPR